MKNIPVTVGFDNKRIIGFMDVDESQLPPDAQFVFALGVTAQLKGAVGEIPREPLSGPYTLHEVSVVSDEKYAAYLAQVGVMVRQSWRSMDNAPKDSQSMLALLVKFTEHPTEDTETAVTIGSWDGEKWAFAGWCWTHDHFTQGEGEVIGWLPMPGHSP